MIIHCVKIVLFSDCKRVLFLLRSILENIHVLFSNDSKFHGKVMMFLLLHVWFCLVIKIKFCKWLKITVSLMYLIFLMIYLHHTKDSKTIQSKLRTNRSSQCKWAFKCKRNITFAHRFCLCANKLHTSWISECVRLLM